MPFSDKYFIKEEVVMLAITMLNALKQIKDLGLPDGLETEMAELLNKKLIMYLGDGYVLTKGGEIILKQLEEQNVKSFEEQRVNVFKMCSSIKNKKGEEDD